MRVPWSYLPQQFARVDEILALVRAFVPTGDFTLGKPVAEFEQKFGQNRARELRRSLLELTS